MEMDKDLAARQEARILCHAAETAQKILSGFSQEKLDEIVEAVSRAFSAAAATLLTAFLAFSARGVVLSWATTASWEAPTF